MSNRWVSVCAIILASTLAVCAQSTIDENRVYRPTEEELAANKRLRELLKHPTFITLRLLSQSRDVPRENPTDTPAPYKLKDWISFQLLITQNFSEELRLVNYMNPYYEYRPELTRDGEILPYTKEADQRRERVERGPTDGSRLQVTLKPGREYGWIDIKLEDWYEPLG